MAKTVDGRPPLQRSLDEAAGLKPGTWESVEALALLAIEAKDLPEGARLRDAAHKAADGLKPGTWESVKALAWPARAGGRSAGQNPRPWPSGLTRTAEVTRPCPARIVRPASGPPSAALTQHTSNSPALKGRKLHTPAATPHQWSRKATANASHARPAASRKTLPGWLLTHLENRVALNRSALVISVSFAEVLTHSVS